MAINITIWEPGCHWRNAVMVPVFIVLSPVILVVFLVAAALSLVFGRKHSSDGSDGA